MAIKTRTSAPKSKTGGPAKPRSAAPKPQPKPRRPAGAAEKAEIRVFLSYSHKDSPALEKLRTHLAPMERDGVVLWFDGDMNAGDALDANIARELRRAHVFVALLSPDYLASRYCWDIEWRRAMNRRARGTMRIVAVVIRPCAWKAATAARLKLLPDKGKTVVDWRSADHAYLNVAEGIAGVVRSLRKEMKASAGRPTARAKPIVRAAAARRRAS